MNKRFMYILFTLSAVFFVVSLIVYIGSGRHAAKLQPESEKVISAAKRDSGETAKVKLFFFEEASTAAVAVNRDLPVPLARESIYRHFIDLLINTGKNYLSPCPEGVMVRGVFLVKKSGMLVIDFSENLKTLMPGGSSGEAEFIYFFVDNLCYNFKEIKKVKFLIGGSEVKSLNGHIDLEQSFYPDFAFLGIEV
jgi:hypothetical protein